MQTQALLVLAALVGTDPGGETVDRLAGSQQMAARIDQFMEQAWSARSLTPAEPCDDTTFLRRVTLDLAGRIPTFREATQFAADAAPDKRQRVIRRLIEGPEFALHLGNFLDEMIQGKYSGDGEFLAWLRESIQDHRSWEDLFRQVMLGPWNTPTQRRADRFLSRRMQNLDEMTNDASRVFFGVDISCAKCHDHPLADDWKQAHYYGLASFFNRTYQFKGPNAQIAEHEAGDLQYVDRAGAQQSAQVMFLSGQTVADPAEAVDAAWKQRQEQAAKAEQYLPPPHSRREALVRVALADGHFLGRSLVNRLWSNYLGRGLVHPVDQMHSANPSSIPGLLEYLADELQFSGYNLEKLAAAIVQSRAYQLSSTWTQPVELPASEWFAVGLLRPLSPKQFALACVQATGDVSVDEALDESASRVTQLERHRQLEGESQSLVAWIDPRVDGFQSSTTEALFMSNGSPAQQLVRAGGQNLAARLGELTDPGQVINLAVWTTLGRAPDAEEQQYLLQWLAQRAADSKAASRDLIWALLTCAEFRFNH